MTDRWHRFRVDFAGESLYGIAFASEAELEEFIARRGGLVHTSATVPAAELQAIEEPQARGRPSYDAMLQAAVKAIGRQLRACSSLSERARLVLKHLAEIHGAQELPAQSTVRAFLTGNRVAEKVADKSAEKSKRAIMRRTGGNE
jgi:hypothetical protein